MRDWAAEAGEAEPKEGAKYFCSRAVRGSLVRWMSVLTLDELHPVRASAMLRAAVASLPAFSMRSL